MKQDKFEILMDFPGWTLYPEIVNICKYISYNNINNVLCAGAFGGRVAAAICRSFPHVHVTAIDTFHYIKTYEELRETTQMTCGDKYLKETMSLEQFKSMHNYQNITVLKADFFEYTTKHQMVIVELYPYVNTWETIFDRCLLLSDHVLGPYGHLSPSGKEILKKYNYEIVNKGMSKNNFFDIYKVLNKIDT